MGIAKKGKRKLTHNDTEYYWWVADDYNGATGHQLCVTVSTEDKKFLVKYHIHQTDNFYVTVLGTKFSESVRTGGTWKRFASPKFGDTSRFTPKNVVDLIDWCNDQSKELIELDYQGNPITK